MLVTIFFVIVVPESPKWLYTWERFEESKENLVHVAEYNSLPDEKITRIKSLTFDLEQLEKQKSLMLDKESGDNVMSIKDIQSQISKRR